MFTEEIKEAARKQRRLDARKVIRKELREYLSEEKPPALNVKK